MIEGEYAKKGQRISRKKIERNLLEKTAMEFVEEENKFNDKLIFSNRSAR